VQKFNEANGWNCESITELYNQIRDRKAANELMNTLKICDPAVGSGHFLVSALNELIAIKYDLGILQDENGKGFRDFRFEIENDELVVWDEQEDQLFKYNPNGTESKRIQKMLFHEKQTIIENCLFGVDINPNSVKICRLRLWIELLKNAYYKTDGELETLPNIDINIKCGNSLISRFALDADLKAVLKTNKSKWDILSYRNAVALYRNAKDKVKKWEMLDFINSIKNDFQQDIYLQDPKNKQLKKLLGEKVLIENRAAIGDLFEKLSDKDIEQDLSKISRKINQLEQEINDTKNNVIYQNAFEWRFEFPEVLNDEGDFVGFDVVIGNPPYGAIFNKDEKKWISNNYNFTDYQLDIYMSFFEKGTNTLKEGGLLCFIVPNSWLLNLKTPNIRKLLFQNSNTILIRAFEKPVFEEAVVDTLIVLSQNRESKLDELNITIETKQEGKIIENTFSKKDLFKSYKTPVNIYLSKKTLKIVLKTNNLKRLSEISNITQGTKPFQKGKGKPKQTAKTLRDKPFVKDYKVDETFRPLLRGSLINKYITLWNNNYYISYGDWLAEPRYSGNFDASKKIVIRQTGSSIIATLDKKQFILRDNLYSVTTINKEYPEEVILGLLNSKFINWYYQNVINNEVGEALAQVKKGHLVNLPVPNYNMLFRNISTKVTSILAQKQADPSADTSELETAIDALVYELYDLTAAEIALIEKG
jgi:hypothetical protein